MNPSQELRRIANTLSGPINKRNPELDSPPRDKPTHGTDRHLPLNGLVKWEKSRKFVKFLGMYKERDQMAVIEADGHSVAVPYIELSALPTAKPKKVTSELWLYRDHEIFQADSLATGRKRHFRYSQPTVREVKVWKIKGWGRLEFDTVRDACTFIDEQIREKSGA